MSQNINLVGNFQDGITPKLKKLSREISGITRSFAKMQARLRPIAKEMGTIAMATERVASAMKSQRRAFESNTRALSQYRREMGKAAAAARKFRPSSAPGAPRRGSAPRGGGGGGAGAAGIGGMISLGGIGMQLSNLVTQGILRGFQLGTQLLQAPVKFITDGIGERIEDEMSDIKAAGGIYSISKRMDDPIVKSFAQAEALTKDTNRYLAELAGALPGDTQDYINVAKQISDSIGMIIANDKDQALEIARGLAEARGGETASFDKGGEAAMQAGFKEMTGQLTKLTVLASGGGPMGAMGLPQLTERIISSDTISTGMFRRYAAVFKDPQIMGALERNIEKINDYTIRFTLSRADSTLLSNLATDYAVILSQEYGDSLIASGQLQDMDNKPIGTGPYYLKDYRAGSYIRYFPNPNYWRDNSKLEQLIYDITASDTGRLTKLLTNECDVIAYPIAHNEIKSRVDLTLDEVTAFNVGYLGFNTQKPPFDDINVRKAVAHVINKQAILDTVYFGQAEEANTIIPTSSWANPGNITTPEFSLEKAKRLLVEAGYPNGFTINMWAMPVQRSYNPDALTMAKLIQADLKKIDIKVNVVSYEWQEFLKRLAEGEHQTVLLGWAADHPDPDNFFSPLLSCVSASTGSNRTFWCNKDYDSLITSAVETSNLTKRKQYYKDALAIIAQELPLVPIAHSKRYQARNTEVKGTLMSAFGGINFDQVSKQ